MKRFKDGLDKEWDIGFTVGLIEKIKNHPGLRDDEDKPIDLGNAFQNDALVQLDSDVVLLCNTLYVICESQCAAVGIEDWQFGERLVGDAIDEAKEALFAALLDFFPKSKRALLEKVIAKQNAAWNAALQGMDTMMGEDRVNDLIGKAIRQAMEAQEEAVENLSTSGKDSTE